MFVQSEMIKKENGYNFFYFENGNVSSEGTLKMENLMVVDLL